jgi:precorrin-6Y C5,15-methyltransferase (decarboxylating)/precorrin-6A/cobalt-precorrin-6A reductase
MSDIIIFGGTTEGRELAEWAVDQGIRTLVSVATEYGRQVMEDRPNLTIHEGRLDEHGMMVLLEEEQPRLVLDATHPHAQEVTRVIRAACQKTGLPYVRVLRKAASASPMMIGEENRIWVDTAQEAAQILKTDQEKVLLTTGSKELHIFTEDPKLRERIFARVLPTSKVITMCEEQGLLGKQIIAMQGPFSADMNVALLHATGTKWLVTKESGAAGGYQEKLDAARICGVKTIIIGRPAEESGVSFELAQQLILDQFQSTKHESDKDQLVKNGCNEGPEPEIIKISLVGMGMGTGSQLTQEALHALVGSDTVFGAARMLKDLESYLGKKQVIPLYMGNDICSYIKTHPECRNISVIYSGDTGYHSGSRSMILAAQEHFKEKLEMGTLEIQVYPGISTVSALCARFRTDWTELYLASAHGQDCDVIKLLDEHKKIFLLLGGDMTIRDLCTKLTDQGYGDTVRVQAGIRLGYPDEQLLDAFAKQLTQVETEKLAAVILKMTD